MAAAKIDVDVPTVEDRVQDMRQAVAMLFLTFDAFAEWGESGNYGEITKAGYLGLATIAREIYADLRAVEEALTSDDKRRGIELCPFVWPAPDVDLGAQ